MKKTFTMYFKALFILGVCIVIAIMINLIVNSKGTTIQIDKKMACAGMINTSFTADGFKEAKKEEIEAKRLEQERLAKEKAEREEAERKAKEEAERKEKEEAERLEQERLAKEKVKEDYDTGSWETGLATAYGGYSDAAIADNQRTATGATVTESSMGVAIPVAWGRSDLYGHKVLIEYGGDVVEAVINDCGGLAGGARSLDLQPGVFHEFGYDSCNSWGVRTVRYKII